MKKSSYQKLKAQLAEQREINGRLFSDKAFFIETCVIHGIRKRMANEISKALFIGDSKPKGIISYEK